jgi:hypothetical protein
MLDDIISRAACQLNLAPAEPHAEAREKTYLVDNPGSYDLRGCRSILSARISFLQILDHDGL